MVALVAQVALAEAVEVVLVETMNRAQLTP
jgi:hypothetical protein